MGEKIVAVDYKSKYFILYDESCVDDEDFVIEYISTTAIIHNDGALKNHVNACIYYGIPAYVGSNQELKDRINKLEEEYMNENK